MNDSNHSVTTRGNGGGARSNMARSGGGDRRDSGARASHIGNDHPAQIPAVDIMEDESGIVLLADMPGASREALSVRIDGNALTIEAPIELGEAEGIEPVYSEVRAGRYRRSFTLSRELDVGRIEAALKDGVLTVTVPKLEHAKPRRIEVRTA